MRKLPFLPLISSSSVYLASVWSEAQHCQVFVGRRTQKVFSFSIFGLQAWNSLIPKISFWGNPNNVLKLMPERKWTGIDLCGFLLLVSCYFRDFLKNGPYPSLVLLSESKLISWPWGIGVRGTGLWAKWWVWQIATGDARHKRMHQVCFYFHGIPEQAKCSIQTENMSVVAQDGDQWHPGIGRSLLSWLWWWWHRYRQTLAKTHQLYAWSGWILLCVIYVSIKLTF